MDVMVQSLKGILVQWDLEGETFRVSRSQSPEHAFEVLAPSVDQRFFLDTEANHWDYNRRYYYLVEGLDATGEVVSQDGPTTFHYNERSGVELKILHESEIALKRMRTPEVHFLLRKRGGRKKDCPDCVNQLTGKREFSGCKTCGGTGQVGGGSEYFPPIARRMSRDVPQIAMASSEMDDERAKLSSISGWITNYPLLYPDDVMVDSQNQRYRIVQVTPRTSSQVVIRQILQMNPLERGHPSYEYAVGSEGFTYDAKLDVPPTQTD